MKPIWMHLGLVLGSCLASISYASEGTKMKEAIFKVTTMALWEASQGQELLHLAAGDQAFVHFAEADDIERIAGKFFKGQAAVMVLELDPERLQGRLVKERNPGGVREYYHLYEGSIPMTAVTSQRILALPVPDKKPN